MDLMKSNQIWEDLESDPSLQSGLIYKRFSADVKPDVFISLKVPEKLRCIAFGIKAPFTRDLSDWNALKDIRIETAEDKNSSNKMFLLVLLLSKQHKDIFCTLCEDLIADVSDIEEEDLLITRLTERLAKWQALFEKVSGQGLSIDAQRGLYGEVFFLRNCLDNIDDPILTLKSWTGPERSVQDFHREDWAVEVKTTHGKNHQKIHINSERQLDDSIIPNIFLYHLSLEVRNGNGESLNKLIDSVCERLESHSTALRLFNLKLIESGYFERHRPQYEDTGYSVRQENIYIVRDQFPRITEQQIPSGVGDVKYSIVLTESQSWRIEESELYNQISI